MQIETVNIDGKEIPISEIVITDATTNSDILRDVEAILEAYEDWDKSAFELSIEYPELFNSMIGLSTGIKIEDLETMKAKDYDLLVFTFLSVNAEFFIQRLKLIQLGAA